MSAQDAVASLLGRVRDWWQRQEELRALDDKEIGRVAADLHISTDTLKDLVARGPDAAHLLYERMEALGISKEEVYRSADGLMRDLQRTCACCDEKRVCEHDLREHPGDPVWKSYCHNTVTLEALLKLKASA